MDVIINGEIDHLPEGHVPILNRDHFYHNICTQLGYSSAHPPIADLLRRYHQLDGQWVIVSPIYWQATHNDAMIVACGRELSLSEQESRLWFREFSDRVALDEMKTHYHDAHTWLLQYDGKPTPVSQAPSMLHHQSLMPELTALDGTLFWQKLITEHQMFLGSHPLNKERTESYAINGIWVWGAGSLSGHLEKSLMCYDASLFSIATILSTNVSFFPSKTFDHDLLLCPQLSLIELSELQAQLQQHTVRWYWNNLAYQSSPKSWRGRLKKLFNRGGTHDH